MDNSKATDRQITLILYLRIVISKLRLTSASRQIMSRINGRPVNLIRRSFVLLFVSLEYHLDTL